MATRKPKTTTTTTRGRANIDRTAAATAGGAARRVGRAGSTTRAGTTVRRARAADNARREAASRTTRATTGGARTPQARLAEAERLSKMDVSNKTYWKNYNLATGRTQGTKEQKTEARAYLKDYNRYKALERSGQTAKVKQAIKDGKYKKVGKLAVAVVSATNPSGKAVA